MTFVIAEPCIDIIDKACLNACPVACIEFDEGLDRKLYIDPDGCIDCAACEPACPVEAIYSEFDLPIEWQAYADIDALWFRDKEAARVKVRMAKDDISVPGPRDAPSR
jgi:NAD-dependent dihydropyrimidine dehydrogenase PreA subunit